MAGSFGYNLETADVSLQMAELDLFPALRQQFDDVDQENSDATLAKDNTSPIIVADGTSCRAQIQDGLQRQAIHVAELLDQALHV